MVSYKIMCRFQSCSGGLPYEFSRQLVVMEHPLPFEERQNKETRVTLKTCACKDQGYSTVYAEFGKNVFFSNEVVTAKAGIDNSHSLVPVESL